MRISSLSFVNCSKEFIIAEEGKGGADWRDVNKRGKEAEAEGEAAEEAKGDAEGEIALIGGVAAVGVGKKIPDFSASSNAKVESAAAAA